MTTTHPLATTITRANERLGYLGLRLGVDDGNWASLADFVSPASPSWPAINQTVSEVYGTHARNTVASIVLESFLWRVVTSGLAIYWLDNRVIDLRPDKVAMLVSDAYELEAMALQSTRFLVLPDDPAAGHPDAVFVVDEAALRSAMKDGLRAHFTEIIDELTAVFNCKPQGLWLNVADRLAAAVIYALPMLVSPCAIDRMELELERLQFVPHEWLAARRPGVLTACHDGQCEPYLDRLTCCQYYRRNQVLCATCPRLSKEERHARHLAFLVSADLETTGD